MRSRNRKNVNRQTPKRNGEVSSRRKYRSRVAKPGRLTRLLYHSEVGRTSRLTLAMLLAWTLAPADLATANSSIDRLERFRDLAGHRLATIQLGGGSRTAEDEREIYALLDDEVVQNVASGGLFASEGFLQERLDGFAEAWGGASFRALR